MATRSQDAQTPRGLAHDPDAEGRGWLLFAAVMLGLAGVWNVIDGLLAIGNSRVYEDRALIFSDLQTWGWIALAVGILQIVAAFGVTTGSEAARWFGIAAAVVSALGQLAFLPAHPIWGVSMIMVDVLVIHALAMYGGRKAAVGTRDPVQEA